ncbi:thioredoxin family protein [Fimbriiglobus ruber]|uniref:Protein folding and stabilization n=1 Tax=Fimbriiglobus ruber TaxID=1908690 RepID=A0A225E1A8_9BACT|nr:thioredoxin family protein [Fimbriiglobus ruber]OWK46983.1 protein folding and stabilization [Fimbriiglobus ruber]
MTILSPRAVPGLVAAAALVAGMTTGPAHAANPPAVLWRTDYQTARKEAQEKGLPLLVEIGSENCVFCRKQDATTFRDVALVAMLNEQFVPVRIDGGHEPAFVQAMKVQMFPTTVLAGPDGKIVGFLQGYVSADQLRDHAKRAILGVTTPDWVARDLQEANKAIAGSDYTRAVSLLKGITADAKDSPARTKAVAVLAEVERSAADRVARAKKLEDVGETTAAAAELAEVVKTYAGTQAAVAAATRLSGAASADARLRGTAATELLAAAREEYRSRRYAECLDKCDQLAAKFSDRPESKDAATLANQIKSDPDLLVVACDQLAERSAAMYLTLAEAWAQKGQTKEAVSCLEKVVQLTPNGRSGEVALGRLTSLKKGETTPGVTVGFQKNAK